MGGSGEDTVHPYPLVEDLVEPAVRVRMPRAPRVVAPGDTIHVVARCTNWEFYFTTADDFGCLLAPTADPLAEARDPHWITQRPVGSPAFIAPYVPRRGRRRSETMASHNQEVQQPWVLLEHPHRLSMRCRHGTLWLGYASGCAARMFGVPLN
jgi:hypothetical protein